MLKWIKQIGPGTLVAAAFIGPGTVTMCTLAGANFGYTLMWAMLLSILVTILLQEAAARIGIITQKGLAEVVKEQIANPIWRTILVVLMLSAIVIGNAAYEAGNISGASLGVVGIFGDYAQQWFPTIIGIIAFLLMNTGSYRLVERSLIILVLLMSVSFILTAIVTKPDPMAFIRGLFIPSAPTGSTLIIIGLIGTTVVPYNLFLHVSLVKEKWKNTKDLGMARKDLLLSILLGGLVSMAIIVSAAAIQQESISTVLGLAKGLEPLYGKTATMMLGIGLFAAGITSAITAPLAAAYVAQSSFGWGSGMKDIKFKLVWGFILLVGVTFSSLGLKPLNVITFAQVTNGLLLPVMSIMILWLVNKSAVLGKYKNTPFQNILFILVVLTAILLGGKGIFSAFQM